MNRAKLKAYAPQARRDFIKAVTDRAAYYGLTKNNIETITEKGDVAIIGGQAFPRAVAAKRKRLEERIRQHGFEQVMEAMAYTWFNRFVAIRFMELHGYLDHGYRVLSHPEGKATPEIVEHAEHVDLPKLDREKVIELKLESTKEAELYGLLLIAQCNALSKAMPFLFEAIDDETELLLPENLLHSDSLIRKLVSEIPEEEWLEVEIIGWLYESYIAEKYREVIGSIVKSEDIPAATQRFTPKWIVRYLVQNSLGKQWVSTYPDSPLKQQMEYYIEPAEQTPEVQKQLNEITPMSLNPEELTLLDPAGGSGHILVESYDILKAIYQERGYRSKDIPRLILQKNLFGLEIDDRAAQLAAFALMMKARADDRRIFDSDIKPHVLAIQESKGLNAQEITEALNTPILKAKLPPPEMLFEEMEDEQAPLFSRKNLSIRGEISQSDVAQLIDLFEHGKTFGSLISVPEELAKRLPTIAERIEDVMAYGDMFGKTAGMSLMPLVEQARILAGMYNSVVTNPPYMGSMFYCPPLKQFVRQHYEAGNADLYGCFILRNLAFTADGGFTSMITIPNWMFLTSFERLRNYLYNNSAIDSLIHNGRGVWGSDFGSCSFVLRRNFLPQYRAVFKRLFDRQGSVANNEELQGRFNNGESFYASGLDFKKIPRSPIAYWVSEKFVDPFIEATSTIHDLTISDGQTKTGDNDKFLRQFWEVSSHDVGFKGKWWQHPKGGPFRRWYGNVDWVIDWSDEARTHYRRDHVARILPEYLWGKRGISWTLITSCEISFRSLEPHQIFNLAAPSLFFHDESNILKCLGFLNTKYVARLLKAINPTLNMNVGEVRCLPLLSSIDEMTTSINLTVGECLSISKSDWDFYETSWDFTELPLLTINHEKQEPQEEKDKENSSDFPNFRGSLPSTYTQLRIHWREMTLEMQRLEEENNRIFIDAYGLQDEITPEVPLNEITLTCNPHYRYASNKSEGEREALLLSDTMKELISYSIGCIMGRYSLDKPGLIYANRGNQGFNPRQYQTFPADQDGIITLTDTNWFEDDIANRVIDFIAVAWPKESLEENLEFIAESLDPNRGESSIETIRRYLATGFFKHHLSMYKKRPIYWLFSSGKQRAFQCLVCLHRYNEGTLSRMRTDYVIPLQGKMSARIDQLTGDITAATSTSHRKKLEKEKDKLIKQLAELRAFDEKLRHYADQRINLDLDDGVKVNYGRFGDLLAEVKAVTGSDE
jgi:hypothetical protein